VLECIKWEKFFDDKERAARVQTVWDGWFDIHTVLKSRDPLNEPMLRQLPTSGAAPGASSPVPSDLRMSMLGDLVGDAFALGESALLRDCQLQAVAYVHQLRHSSWKPAVMLTKSGVPVAMAQHLNNLIDEVGEDPLEFTSDLWEEVVVPLVCALSTAVAEGRQLPFIQPEDLKDLQVAEEKEEEKELVQDSNLRTPEQIHELCLAWYDLFSAGSSLDLKTGRLYQGGYPPSNVTPYIHATVAHR
jgi:hypothetical protein